MVPVTNSRSIVTACSLVAEDRSRLRKTVRMPAADQTPSMVRIRTSPRRPGNSSPSRCRSAPSTAAMYSLGTSGSRMAAANSRSLFP
jgi:hypothetical protein